jgi:hypothetical protein
MHGLRKMSFRDGPQVTAFGAKRRNEKLQQQKMLLLKEEYRLRHIEKLNEAKSFAEKRREYGRGHMLEIGEFNIKLRLTKDVASDPPVQQSPSTQITSTFLGTSSQSIHGLLKRGGRMEEKFSKDTEAVHDTKHVVVEESLFPSPEIQTKDLSRENFLSHPDSRNVDAGQPDTGLKPTVRKHEEPVVVTSKVTPTLGASNVEEKYKRVSDPAQVVEAVHMYDPNGDPNMTSLLPGEKCILLKKGVRGWWLVRKIIRPDDKGFVPSTFLKHCDNKTAQFMLEYFNKQHTTLTPYKMSKCRTEENNGSAAVLGQAAVRLNDFNEIQSAAEDQQTNGYRNDRTLELYRCLEGDLDNIKSPSIRKQVSQMSFLQPPPSTPNEPVVETRSLEYAPSLFYRTTDGISSGKKMASLKNSSSNHKDQPISINNKNSSSENLRLTIVDKDGSSCRPGLSQENLALRLEKAMQEFKFESAKNDRIKTDVSSKKKGPTRWRGSRIPPVDHNSEPSTCVRLMNGKTAQQGSPTGDESKSSQASIYPSVFIPPPPMEAPPPLTPHSSEGQKKEYNDETMDRPLYRKQKKNIDMVGREKWKERTTHVLLTYTTKHNLEQARLENLHNAELKKKKEEERKAASARLEYKRKKAKQLGRKAKLPRKPSENTSGRPSPLDHSKRRGKTRRHAQVKRFETSLDLFRRVHGNKSGVAVHKGDAAVNKFGISGPDVPKKKNIALKKSKNVDKRSKFYVPPFATDYELLFRSLNEAVRYGELSLHDSVAATKMLLSKDVATLNALQLGLKPENCHFSEDLERKDFSEGTSKQATAFIHSHRQAVDDLINNFHQAGL